jgi:FemAB-related protein (PEP-CTERM system-associated)
MGTATARAVADPITGVVVRRRSPGDQPAWDGLVERLPEGTPCHLSGWLDVATTTWGHADHSLVAERDGRLAGVLPLVHVRSRLFGSVLVSTPNAVYGGAIGEDAAVRRSLTARAKAIGRTLEVDHVELREGSPAIDPDPDLHRGNLYVTFERSLTADEDTVFRSFPRDVRRMIRLGPKNGLHAEVGGTELLDDLYDVYATSVRSLGTPVYPKRLFDAFLREFAGRSDVLVVRHGRQVAAGVLSFYFRDVVLPYYAGAYPTFYRAGVNNFMYWELMRHAISRGYTRFDFGRSKVGTGAFAFKQGWGMTARVLPYGYYLVRATRTPSLNPLNPRYRLPIELWKRLPLSLTKLLGPRIVRGLP